MAASGPPPESDKTNRVLQLALASFGALTQTVHDEIGGLFGTFATLAEKGTAAFLLAAGATFISFGIVLALHSESLFDKEIGVLIQRQSNQKPTASVTEWQTGARPGDAPEAAPEARAQSGVANIQTAMAPSITLILGGIVLILGGAATSLISYKWRLEIYSREQAYNLEGARLQVQLRQAGIEAIAEDSQIIGQQSQMQIPRPVMPPEPR